MNQLDPPQTQQSPDIWKDLNQDTILDICESLLETKLSNICEQRNSYVNRVYELEIAKSKERIIVKFYRPNRWSEEQILAEHSFLKKLYEADIPVIPAKEIDGCSLYYYENSDEDMIPIAIFPKMGGRALDEFDKDTWLLIGRLIGRMHSVSQNIEITNRIEWTPSHATRQHIHTIENSQCIPPDYQQAFFKTANLFINRAEQAFCNINLIPLHGDCHKGNFIIRPAEGVFLTDFDDMSVGPAIQDLWMLLPDIDNPDSIEMDWFIEGYETFRQFPYEQKKLIPYLRGMRIIHFIAWSAIQYKEKHFKETFCEWGTPRYWNQTIRELQSIVYDENILPT